MLRLAAVLLFAWLAVAGAAMAEDADGTCHESNRLCEGEEAALRLALYAFEPIRSPGPDMVRVVYADDYSRPMPAIVLERRENGEGRLTLVMLRYPPRFRGAPTSGQFERVTRSASVSRETTAIMFGHAGSVFESPVVAPNWVPADPQFESICLHPRQARIEVRIGGRWSVRERNTCNDDAALRLAFDLGDLAVAHRPECAALDPRAVGSVMYRLAACGRLDGELRTAASAMNLSELVLGTSWDTEQAGLMAARLSSSSRLEWNGGEQSAIGEIIAPALAAMTAGGDYSAWFSRVEGQGPNAARAFGRLEYSRGGEGDTPYERGSAAMEVAWTREPNGPWRISTVKVGKFEVDEDG